MSPDLIESVEGMGDSPVLLSGGQVWEWLQAEREGVTQNLLAEGPLFAGESSNARALEASDESALDVQWRHRELNEQRLRELNDALDRLSGGTYGKCADCAAEIDPNRLMANPAALRCFNCQTVADADVAHSTL